MRFFAHQLFFLATVLACSVQSCKDPVLEDDEYENSSFATPDWTDATHGKKASPNYEVVFADNEVKKLELRMTAADWASVKADMKALWGFDFGSATGGKPGGPGAFPTEEPAYVPVSLKLNDIEWYKVGFRLKGNSTLGNSWRSGIYKLPFRLNFDKYEDDYPQIED
ncbi:MAG: spore coat protein CotH, partial [Bacteroidota bacterium]